MNNAEELIILPDSFWTSYQLTLDQFGIKDLCFEETKGGNIGGKGIKASHAHFAHRCGNSCSRSVYMCRFTDVRFKEIATLIVSSLTSDEIAFLDIAAGSGGGTLGILSSIEHKRKTQQIPSLPLTIHIYAVDHSQESLDIYETMIDKIKYELKNVCIDVAFNKLVSDIKDVSQAAKLCDIVKQNKTAKSYIIFVSTLSGIKKSGYDELHPFFRHILESFSNHECIAIWIEPSIPSAEDFISKIIKRLFANTPWLTSKQHNSYIKATYTWQHKIINKNIPGGLCCLHYERCNLI